MVAEIWILSSVWKMFIQYSSLSLSLLRLFALLLHHLLVICIVIPILHTSFVRLRAVRM